jgi:hypothetical protein
MTKEKKRLEKIRQAIRNENISYGELFELQGLVKHIDPNDTELLQWADPNDIEPLEAIAMRDSD